MSILIEFSGFVGRVVFWLIFPLCNNLDQNRVLNYS